MGVSVVAFMLGGGLALAMPPSPVQPSLAASVPVTAPPRVVEPLSVVYSVAQRHPEPVIVAPVVVPAHGVPSDPTKRCPQFEPAFRKYGLLPVKVFSYIAWRESNCRIKAINIVYDKHGKVVWSLNANGSYDSGLLQINSSWKTVTRKVCGGGLDRLMLLDCNLRVGKYLLEHGGIGHWGL